MKISPTIVVDSREQRPLRFANMPSVRGTLSVADYSVSNLTHRIGCERKSLPDLVQCVGSERDRFVRELGRLAGLRFRCVVVEATLADIEAGQWRGKVVPNAVLGSIASWSTRHSLPFFFCGNAAATARFVERWLYMAARCIAEEAAAAASFVVAAPEPIQEEVPA